MAVNLSPVGGVAAQFFDNSGNVLTGGKIYTYLAGTTTPAVAYVTNAGNVPWSNPIVLDASGRVSGSGEIWLTDNLSYKFLLKDSNDVLIATYDNITGINSNFVNFVSETEIQTATAGQTVFTLTTMEYQPGVNNLLVFVDGVNQYEGSSYSFVETNSTTVTFVSGLHVGAEVKFTTATPINTLTADAATTAYTPPFANSVTTNVEDKLAQTINVLDFGADNTGATDTTAAIQSAINSTPNGSTLYFAPGTYEIGQVIFSNKSLNVSAYGATFNLVGNSAGFYVQGIVNGFSVNGGTIIGDDTVRDLLPSTDCQFGWYFGNTSGSQVQNVCVTDVRVEKANSGFAAANGTGISGTNTYSVKFVNCYVLLAVGSTGGRGYGFQFSQAPNSMLVNCTADDCGRHGIYFAEGRNYSATNCMVLNHRETIYPNYVAQRGTLRYGLAISRSRNVTVSNCVFDNCYDGTVLFDRDAQGVSPENVADGNVLSNCTFKDSDAYDVVFGSADPVTDGIPLNATVTGCTFVSKATPLSPSMNIYCGEGINISNNTWNTTVRGITFYEEPAAPDCPDYTDIVAIQNNIFKTTSYAVRISDGLQTNTKNIVYRNNFYVGPTDEIEFVSGENATTNNNLIYKRNNGTNALKQYASTGTDITIYVGGVDSFTFAPSAPTSVATISGGTNGQKLTLLFQTTNAVTVKQTSGVGGIYLAGSVDFVSSQYDTLTLIYQDNAWREVSRSIN